MRRWLLVLTLLLSGCRFCGKGPLPGATSSSAAWGPPPADDAPPASLGSTGVVVEQPKAGETLQGKWVAVTGWLDLTRYRTLLVVGGSDATFFAPAQGHGALPTVPVLVRSDGRFVAPRVPLDEGTTEIDVIPLPVGGGWKPPDSAVQKIDVVAHGTQTVPVTLTVTPWTGMAPLTASLQAHTGAPEGSVSWQWDFEGDGHFDATSTGPAAGTHVYPSAGAFQPMVRTFDGTRWVYAVARVKTSLPTDVLADAPAQQPRALTVDVDWAGWQTAVWQNPDFNDGGCADARDHPDGGCAPFVDTDPNRFVRAVVLADGDTVRVFDANLHPLRQLSGFSRPSGVATDRKGRIYVADTGNARIQRFNPDGTLDTTFGDQGSLLGISGQPFVAPTTLAANCTSKGWEHNPTPPDPCDPVELTVLDTGRDELVTCLGKVCEPYTVSLTDSRGNSVSDAPPKGITTFASDLWESGQDGAPYAIADSSRLFEEDNSGSAERERSFWVYDRLRKPLVALAAMDPYGPATHYYVGADSKGVVHEWLRRREARQVSLEFPVTALALDRWGTRVELNQLDPDNQKTSTGPIVIYVAGPGHLQRRLFPGD